MIGQRCIEPGDFDARISGESEPSHGDAAVKAGRGCLVLEWLQTDRSDQQAIEMKAFNGQAGESDVSAMRRVEAAAVERDSH